MKVQREMLSSQIKNTYIYFFMGTDIHFASYNSISSYYHNINIVKSRKHCLFIIQVQHSVNMYLTFQPMQFGAVSLGHHSGKHLLIF